MIKPIDTIVNFGVDENMDKFSASHIRTFNTVLIVVTASYLVSLPLYFYQTLYTAAFFLLFMTVLMVIPGYLSWKRKPRLARISLVSNTWLLLLGLSLYLGAEGGSAFAFFASAVLWFMFYNNKRQIILVECINGFLTVFSFWSYSYMDPIWDGDQALLFPIKMSILVVCFFAVIITLVIFKSDNYAFLSLVKQQKVILVEKKEQIEAGIRYALSIQKGGLPLQNELAEFCMDNFTYYLPKDIVSGDFYWIHEDDNRAFMVLGDCTGHGVPGSMVSLIGIYTLDNIIKTQRIESPAELLHALNVSFKSQMKKAELNDGMDISVLMYDKNDKKWMFGSANNSILIAKKNKIEIIKGDKVPIGHYVVDFVDFKNFLLDVDPGDFIYLYSDGFRDQFGGEKGKKIGLKRFKEILENVSKDPFDKQADLLSELFENWKGGYDQIDDVSLVGIKVNMV